MVKICSTVAAALLFACIARAETFRFFGSGGAETQLTPANAASPLNPSNVAGIAYRTNVADVSAFGEIVGKAWKVRLKVRGDASDQTSDRLRTGEAYGQFKVRPWLDVTAGRVIEKWGTGYAWNPTAFVGPQKNPTDPTDRRSAYRGIDMVKADVFVRDTNLSLYAMQHRGIAARVYRLVRNTDVSLHFRHDPGVTREGISLARVFGEALEVHGEIARVDKARAYIQAVAGSQYTLPHNINIVAEIYHGGDGMSGGQWRAFCSDVEESLPRANRDYTPLKMGRDYAFGRVDWPSDSQKNDLEVIGITNLRDRSSIARITFTRRLRPNVHAYLIETEFFGAADSEFAYIQVKRATVIGMRYYF